MWQHVMPLFTHVLRELLVGVVLLVTEATGIHMNLHGEIPTITSPVSYNLMGKDRESVLTIYCNHTTGEIFTDIVYTKLNYLYKSESFRNF